MDFAKGILEKYGWKEGQGIGRHSDGIVKPVKASLKFDTAGLGHDKAVEFNNHWWEKAFNDAANNINVQNASDKTSLSLNNSESVEYSANGYTAKQFTKQRAGAKPYEGTFKKSRVFHGLTRPETSDDDSDDTDANAPTSISFNKVLNDQELLEACGGRTAHKGARHGLKLNGKLNRIEAQDKLFLAKMADSSADVSVPDTNSWTLVAKAKKRKNKIETDDVDMEACEKQPKYDIAVPTDGNTDYIIKCKSKKRKKEQRQRDESLAETFSDMNASNDQKQSIEVEKDEDNNQSDCKKKKKKRKRDTDADEISNTKSDGKEKRLSRKEERRQATLIVEQRTGCISNDGLDENVYKKQKKTVVKNADERDFSTDDEANERLREINATLDDKQKPITVKQVLKEQKRLKRLAKQMEQTLS